MRTPIDIYANELQAQHTIQSDDLLKICHLAKIENVFEKIESFSFEQFFGFTCHLFITTDSQQVREQLAAILPKFGSVAVFSLLKISHHFSTVESSTGQEYLGQEQQLAELSMRCLTSMSVPALIVGLVQAIEAEENNNSHHDIANMVAPALITLTAHHGENILSMLSNKLSSATWNRLQQQLLQTLSVLRAQASLKSTPLTQASGEYALPQLTDLQLADLQLADVAC